MPQASLLSQMQCQPVNNGEKVERLKNAPSHQLS